MKNVISLSSLILMLFVLSVQAQASSDLVIQGYVDRYKDVAVSEMIRTGIPASIKLAQGILESNAGRSHLAVNGNNHFGIKCGSQWKGRTILREDDDYVNGKLIKSCFRAFPSAIFSYKAHSEFLMDPRKAYRYGSLFDLDQTDYKAWAHGLKKAGYATNPKYPQHLIRIIEDYELYKYDYLSVIQEQEDFIEEDLIAFEEQVEGLPESTSAVKTLPESTGSNNGFFGGVARSYTKFSKNGVEYVLSMHGDRLEQIAMELGIELDRLIEYNDAGYSTKTTLSAGMPIYTERKRNKFKGNRKTYRASQGETIFEISQQFAVRCDKLAKRNNVSEKHRFKGGEIVHLIGKK